MSGALAPLLAVVLLGAAPVPTPCAETAGPAETDVRAGTRLRAAPNAGAPSLAVVDADVTLPVSARCGGYAEVRWGGFRGWVRPGDTEGPSLEPAATAADAARLSRARSALRAPVREAHLGPWRLVTDVPPGELPDLDAVASRLPDAFASRTGLVATPGAAQAVVVFSSEARYRAFAEADGSPILRTPGHAGGGLAALVVGHQPLETRVLLVHELTHLLSQRALGEKIPGWLAEGLAEDLAWCRVDGSGRLLPDTLDVGETTRGSTSRVVRERSGPRLTVEEWLPRARAGRLPPLALLLRPDSQLFADPVERRDAATASAMLIRWCLADPHRAEAFREFLTAVSLGGAGDASALAAALDMDVPRLEKGFRDSLR